MGINELDWRDICLIDNIIRKVDDDIIMGTSEMDEDDYDNEEKYYKYILKLYSDVRNKNKE